MSPKMTGIARSHRMGAPTVRPWVGGRGGLGTTSFVLRSRDAARARPLLRRTPLPPCKAVAAAASAAAAAPAPVTGAAAAEAAAPVPPLQPPAHKSRPWDAVKLALRVLAPDWALAALTGAILCASIATTLAFPLAIGNLFDVVKQLGGGGAAGAAAGAAAPAAAAGSPLLGLLGSAASAPPTFRAALLHLSICMVLSPVTMAAVSWLAPLLAERFGMRLRKHLLQEVLRQDQAFFDRSPKGDLVGRLTLDVATLQATLADLVGQRGLRSLLEVLGPMVIIAVKHPLMAVITCAVTPLLSRALRRVVVQSTELSYERQRVASAALEFASDRLSHVQTVQVFGQEEREAAGFRDLATEGYKVAEKYAAYQGLVEGAGRLAVNVGTVSLLGFGGMLVLGGQMTVGTLLAYMVFNLFISLGLSQLAASLGDLGKAIGALERISDLVGSPSPASDASEALGAADSHTDGGAAAVAAAAAQGVASGRAVAPEASPSNGAAYASHGASTSNGTSSSNGAAALAAAAAAPSASNGAAGLGLAMRDVWFRYQGRDDWALRGLTLDVPAGSTLALVGPSGGGKSTVASLLLGLYEPSRGEVAVGGRAMAGPEDWAAVRHRIAAVMQQPMLMSGTVAQQISYGRPEASFEEVVAAARQANADEFIRELPQGYETQVGERGHALSGGQKQRLAIARALLCRPQVLVLDEVTSALDVESEVAIDATLGQLEGCTKLIIAHRLSTVRSADRIAVVVGGQVVELGTHEELLAKEGGAYQRLVLAAEL